MSTKRAARIFGVLCGTCFVFGLMYGPTDIPAMADDGQLPVPEVQGTWQPDSHRLRPIERTAPPRATRRRQEQRPRPVARCRPSARGEGYAAGERDGRRRGHP